MTLYRNKFRIESTRLPGWDYSQNGCYFVTVCIKDRENLLGQIADGIVILNQYGKIVENCWFELPGHYHNIHLDAFVIMPNHIHGIILIDNKNPDANAVPGVPVETGLKTISEYETGLKPVSTGSLKNHGLFEIVRAFKTFSARRINELRNSAGKTIWQPRFYDHVIHDSQSLQQIRDYIVNNPLTWDKDYLKK